MTRGRVLEALRAAGLLFLEAWFIATVTFIFIAWWSL